MKTSSKTNAVLTHYCGAVRIPLSLFREKELVSRLPALADFNLPLLLMGCLDDELPPIWYCDTPDTCFSACFWKKAGKRFSSGRSCRLPAPSGRRIPSSPILAGM